MPIQALGPTVAAERPVYYVTPPNEQPNIFAEFTAGLLQTRTPWTDKVFDARLAALDPSARAKALADLAQMEADAAAKNMDYAIELRRSEDRRLGAITDMLGIESRERIAGGEIAGRQRVAEIGAETEEKKLAVIPDIMREPLAEYQARVAAASAQALDPGADADTRARAMETIRASNEALRGIVSGARLPPETTAAIFNEAHRAIDPIGVGVAGGDSMRDAIRGDLGVPETAPRVPEPARRAGIPGRTQREGDLAAQAASLLKQEPVGGKVAFRGEAPERDLGGGALPPSPAGATPTVGGAPATSIQPISPPVAPPPQAGGFQAKSWADAITDLYDRSALGGFGEPLYTRTPPRIARAAEAVRRVAEQPTALVDVTEAAEQARQEKPRDLVTAARGAGVGRAKRFATLVESTTETRKEREAALKRPGRDLPLGLGHELEEPTMIEPGEGEFTRAGIEQVAADRAARMAVLAERQKFEEKDARNRASSEERLAAREPAPFMRPPRGKKEEEPPEATPAEQAAWDALTDEEKRKKLRETRMMELAGGNSNSR
jgi:hypothetical protein